MAKKPTIIVTPIGTLDYPWLDTPDTKFSDDGIYKTNITCKKEDAETLINTIEEMISAKGKELASQGVKAKRCKYTVYEENSDGTVTFKCKVDAITRLRNGDVWDRAPIFLDANRTKIDPIGLRTGSVCRLALELYAWYNPSQGVGIKLQPKKVQVLEAVLGADSDDEFGDLEYEGGFVGEAASAKSEAVTESVSAEADESEDW